MGTYKKGDLVIVVASGGPARGSTQHGTAFPAWRQCTEAELAATREKHRGDPLDDAGEPRLVSSFTYDPILAGTLLVVERARCAPQLDWHKLKGMSQVLEPKTGTTYWIGKNLLRKI